jgi:hypothetical protein
MAGSDCSSPAARYPHPAVEQIVRPQTGAEPASAGPDGPERAPEDAPASRRRPLPVRRELVVTLAGFALLALVVYGRHVLRGGWYYDDWEFIAQLDLAAEDGVGALWRAADDLSYRPVFSVVLFAMYAIGGTGQAPYLAVGVVAAATQGWLLYWLLRRLRIAWYVAAAAAAMLVAIPVVDATRLWMAAFPSGVAIVLWLLGVHVALTGLGRGRALAWHAGALVLYAAAMLTSELTVPLVGLSPVLYALAAGPRQGLVRAPADLLAAGAVVAYLAEASSSIRPAEGSPGYLLDRARQIWDAGVPVVEQQIPLDKLLWGPLGLLVLVVAGVGIGLSLRRGERPAGLRRELLLTAAGAVFTLAGLVMLLPAEPYYIPRTSGVGDRVSIAAAPGFACLLAGLFALVARGLAGLVRRRAVAPAVFAALALVTVASMGVKEIRAQSAWADSWTQAQAVIGAVRKALGPDVPPGATIVTFRHTNVIVPDDVPVFASVWDLKGAMQFTYRDPSIVAQPYGPTISCGAEGLEMPGGRRPYGEVFFVDAMTYTGRRIASRRACRAAFAAYGA